MRILKHAGFTLSDDEERVFWERNAKTIHSMSQLNDALQAKSGCDNPISAVLNAYTERAQQNVKNNSNYQMKNPIVGHVKKKSTNTNDLQVWLRANRLSQIMDVLEQNDVETLQDLEEFEDEDEIQEFAEEIGLSNELKNRFVEKI